MLPEQSGAVGIGGGVMGAAALHYLTVLGCERPGLVERETLASGSTGHCAGGVRTPLADELHLRLLLDDALDVARCESDLALQARLGIGTRMLEPAEAQALVPQLDTDGLRAAVLCPVAGYVTPDLVVQAYARRAAERGAHIEQSCAA